MVPFFIFFFWSKYNPCYITLNDNMLMNDLSKGRKSVMHAFQHSWCPRAPPPLPPRYGRTVRYGLPGSKGEPHTGNRWSPEDSKFPETTGFAENDGLRNPVVSGFPRFPVTSSLRNPVTRVKFVHFKQSISNIRNEYNYTWTRIDIYKHGLTYWLTQVIRHFVF